MAHIVEFGIVQEGGSFFLVKFVYNMDSQGQKELSWWSKLHDLLNGIPELKLLRWIMRSIGESSNKTPIPLKELPFDKFKNFGG